MRRIIYLVVVGFLLSLAWAAPPSQTYMGTVSSDGEASPVLAGIYGCREKGGEDSPTAKVGEDTLLILHNPTNDTMCACVRMITGNYSAGESVGFAVAGGLTDLSRDDVDVINLCEMMESDSGAVHDSGGPRHPTGAIEVVLSQGDCMGTPRTADGGPHGWTKLVTYKGRKRVDTDPFSAKVLGSGLTELREVPPGAAPNALTYCGALVVGIYGDWDDGRLPEGVYADDSYEAPPSP